jgi:hypothetical protein
MKAERNERKYMKNIKRFRKKWKNEKSTSIGKIEGRNRRE